MEAESDANITNSPSSTIPSNEPPVLKKESIDAQPVNKKQQIIREARKLVGHFLETIDKHRLLNRESTLAFSKNVLKAFAAAESVSADKFVQSGGLKSIMAAIKAHATSSEVVEFGCRSILALTIYDTKIIDETVNVNGIEYIIDIVGTQAADAKEEGKVCAIKMLRNMTQTEENRARIVSLNGIEAMIDVMKKSTESPRVLSHSALVLSNLTFGNANIKTKVGELGGITSIAKAMADHIDFQAMQARGSLALRNLFYSSEANQRIASECGAIQALVQAVERYQDDREVVHQSCVALTNLSNENVENRELIVQEKGAGVAVHLMKKYENSATVHDDAISIIRNIAVGSSQAQEEIGANGGTALICRALEVFGKDQKIVDKSCMALRYLCFHAPNRQIVYENKGLERLSTVIKDYISNAKTVEHALLAIGNATFQNNENKAVIGRCGGIVTIIKAVEQHRMNASIQQHGCRVLRNLSDGFELNRRLQAESGAITTAVFAMMGFPDDVAVQEQTCAMLLNIGQSPANIEALRKADVGRLAEKAISLHNKHRGILLQAGSLLDLLNGFSTSGEESTSSPTQSTQPRPKGLLGLIRRRASRDN